jgi:HD-like signal output (HDOD) protein
MDARLQTGNPPDATDQGRKTGVASTSPPTSAPASSAAAPASSARRKVLFVDDEPMVLAGLQRTLRGLRQEWEMTFATSGAEALALLEHTPYDVVVSDMRMPDMTGADLLCEVMRRYPRTARLILSGFADRELSMQCAAAAHQFLTKPCDPDTLKTIINRTVELDCWLQNDSLQTLAARLTKLPSLPAVYFELIERLRDPEASLEDIGQIVSRDPAMTAKLLQLVNSAFFGMPREVGSAAEAVMLLGLETVKGLALWMHVFAEYQGATPSGFSLERLSTHCLSTGILARGIARLEHAPALVADEALTAGMLHDVGKLVLAANLPNEYAQVRQRAKAQQVPLIEAEREAFGACHAELGAYVLGLWGLPVAIVEAVAFHHRPGASSLTQFSPLTAVHVANVLDYQFLDQEADATPSLDLAYLARLGLQGRIEAWQDHASGAISTMSSQSTLPPS